MMTLGTVLSKDENEDEMAEILRDKEYLNEQYDVLFSRYNALELDLDDLRNEKDKETIKLAKYEEVIKQYESDMEILKSQVVPKPNFLPCFLGEHMIINVYRLRQHNVKQKNKQKQSVQIKWIRKIIHSIKNYQI